MPNPVIIHFLRGGRTPCQMRGVPGEWPPGHTWAHDRKDVTCTQCLEGLERLERAVDLTSEWIRRVQPNVREQVRQDAGGARVAELAFELVAPDAGAACAVCHRRIDSANSAIWAGTPSFPAPAVCICGDCLIAGLQLLFTALRGA